MEWTPELQQAMDDQMAKWAAQCGVPLETFLRQARALSMKIDSVERDLKNRHVPAE